MGKAKMYGYFKPVTLNRDADRLREKTLRKDGIISKYQRTPKPFLQMAGKEESTDDQTVGKF